MRTARAIGLSWNGSSAARVTTSARTLAGNSGSPTISVAHQAIPLRTTFGALSSPVAIALSPDRRTGATRSSLSRTSSLASRATVLATPASGPCSSRSAANLAVSMRATGCSGGSLTGVGYLGHDLGGGAGLDLAQSLHRLLGAHGAAVSDRPAHGAGLVRPCAQQPQRRTFQATEQVRGGLLVQLRVGCPLLARASLRCLIGAAPTLGPCLLRGQRPAQFLGGCLLRGQRRRAQLPGGRLQLRNPPPQLVVALLALHQRHLVAAEHLLSTPQLPIDRPANLIPHDAPDRPAVEQERPESSVHGSQESTRSRSPPSACWTGWWPGVGLCRRWGRWSRAPFFMARCGGGGAGVDGFAFLDGERDDPGEGGRRRGRVCRSRPSRRLGRRRDRAVADLDRAQLPVEVGTACGDGHAGESVPQSTANGAMISDVMKRKQRTAVLADEHILAPIIKAVEDLGWFRVLRATHDHRFANGMSGTT